MTDNKTIIRTYLEQVWDKHKRAAVDEYMPPNYIQHATGTQPGRDGVKAFFCDDRWGVLGRGLHGR